MAVALKLNFIILSFAVLGQADVSHLGYTRYSGQRAQSLRLQRLESEPTPYPASGYRPNRDFNLPREQPLFPLVNPQYNRPQVSSGFDSLSEPQRPQLLYGSPNQEPRFSPRTRPQHYNGFNNLAETEQHDFAEQSQTNNRDYNSFDESQQPQNGAGSFNNGFNDFEEPKQPQNPNKGFNNGFNNLADPQQPQTRPDLLYGAPNKQEQQPENGFDSLSEPQYNYNPAPARLRQQLLARLQQAQRLQQLQQQAKVSGNTQSQSQSQQQQVFTAPQTLYRTPLQKQRQQQQVQAQSEIRSSRLLAQKPARLTDNREESEEESDARTSETVEEIETTTKAQDKKTVNGTLPAVANTGIVNYYPASAFGFVQPLSGAYVAAANYQNVQPLSAAYVASANYQTVQPASAAYTVGSAFLPQQFTLAAAAPAHLQAW